MPAVSRREPPSAPALGLAWLLRLRWGAGACQLAVLAAGSFFFGRPDALPWLAALIGLTFATNAGLSLWHRRAHSGSRAIVAGVLLLDTLLLTGLLQLSGGAANPFSVFYLVHVALAAVLLDTRGALLLSLATSSSFASLFLFPGPHDPHAHHGADFSVHLHGMWISYTLAACFVGYFVARMARALERRERELEALQRQAARAERLASLSTLAAGAAHELGTPLGTIAIVAGELERACGRPLDAAAIREDATLLRSEAERCRRILDRMAADAGSSRGERPRPIEAGAILERLAADLGRDVAASVRIHEPSGKVSVVAPPHALVQALANLVRNGLDAAAEAGTGSVADAVSVRVEEADGLVLFRVADRGRGIAAEHVSRLGEPFFTTKAPGAGMGLGLFLVQDLADRCGGSLEIESRPGEGATFVLGFPGGPA
ncbi:Sensor histidine kinase PrrB (RegB) [Vulgatibacter incomptus]|uniref:histidine kinase n=1 Tax=Vulgatibacter incomptus TaxID=1391653 RepID=A0A0K1PCP2_9BACT|nr:Sensor histidine kinase PrrB (RegB) [Vulgatibacter incomptus]